MKGQHFLGETALTDISLKSVHFLYCTPALRTHHPVRKGAHELKGCRKARGHDSFGSPVQRSLAFPKQTKHPIPRTSAIIVTHQSNTLGCAHPG